MKRKGLSVLLALCMVLTCAPSGVFANTDRAAGEPETAGYSGDLAVSKTADSETPVENELADSDELLSLYLDETLRDRTDSHVNPLGLSRDLKADMSDASKAVYDILEAGVAKVANGERTSTAFTISVPDDLGMTFSAEASTIEEAYADASGRMNIDLDTILDVMMANCPYELYWYDKTQETTSGCSYSISYYSEEGPFTVSITQLEFKFPAAQEYAGDTAYTVNAQKIGAIQTAVDNIAAVVSENSSLSDYEKLCAYKDKICTLTSYNHEAADNDNTPYGNPWQLIWVFDNDPDTTVVCEGYSKAFQYLCDLSAFTGDVYCYSVTGTMSGGTGAGAHMWNIVHMDDGKNYLVDVTNCDEGTIGAPDLLFLVGYTSVYLENGYSFDCNGKTVVYVYNDETEDLYSLKELKICSAVPVSDHPVAIDKEHFLDKNFRNYVSKNCDMNGDGYLSDEEIAVVTSIDCSSMEIADLTGIEYFTALQSLSCDWNQLTELDVSHNMALTYLRCSDNFLSELDTSCNTVLESLYCDNNQLTALDTVNNTSLKLLFCKGNQIAELNISSPYLISAITEGTVTEYSNIVEYRNRLNEEDLVLWKDKTTVLKYPGMTHTHTLTAVYPQSPTCETAGHSAYWSCSGCNTLFSDAAGKTEITEESTVIPATGHNWDAGVVTTAATCTTVGVKTFTCLNDSTHTRTEAIPATGHDWKAATYAWSDDHSACIATQVCRNNGLHIETANATVIQSAVAASCTETGKTTYTATFNESWCAVQTAETSIPATGHNWDAGQITTAATCTTDGVKTYTCLNDSSHTRTEWIPATGHDWKAATYAWSDDHSTCVATRVCRNNGLHIETATATVSKSTVAASCTEAGKITYTATFSENWCTAQTAETVIPALGHAWSDWTVTTPATETSTGVESRICSRCGETETRDIPVLIHTHTLSAVAAQSPTCTEDGHEAYWSCSGCGRLFRDAAGTTEVDLAGLAISATGHNWNAGTVTTAATCTTDGVKTFTCLNDSTHTRTEAIPATGHDWKAATYAWSDDHSTCVATRVCRNNGLHIETANATVSQSTVAASCTETGKTTYTATFSENWCAVQTAETAIPATGHNWDAGQITTAATCTAAGVKTFTCLNDSSHTRTEAIPATGHDWSAWSVTTPATETTTGVESRSCSRCGETETRSIPELTHTHSLTANAAQSPTCTENGHEAYWSCSGCGRLFRDAAGTTEVEFSSLTIPATGHNWNEGQITTAATCTTDGVKTFTCLNDNSHTRTETIPATGHHMTKVEAKEATRETDGNIEYWICSNCGKLFRDEAGTQEITLEDTVIRATGTEAVAVEALISAIGTVTKSSGDAIAAARAAFNALTAEQKAMVSSDALKILEEAEAAYEELQKPDDPKPIENPFTDVKDGNYFKDAVLWAVNHDPQITNGTSATTFSPADPCTRGQAVTFLWRACGAEKVNGVKNPFTDVKEGSYYYDAVLWAYSNNITNGTTSTTFGPNDKCNRGQIVTFLWRALGKPASGAVVSFKDVGSGAFYYEPVRWAVEKNVTKGTSETTFSPADPCTRGQIVTFLYRALGQQG